MHFFFYNEFFSGKVRSNLNIGIIGWQHKENGIFGLMESMEARRQ